MVDVPVYRPPRNEGTNNVLGEDHETETVLPPHDRFHTDIQFTKEFAPPDIHNDRGFIQGKPQGFPSLKQLIVTAFPKKKR